MRELTERLEAVRAVIETKFLETSDMLERAIEGIAALGAKLDELTNAFGPEASAATTAQLNGTAARLLALPARQLARQEAIAALGTRRADLAARIEDMRLSLAYMRAFTVSIKITAGGIVSADGEFGVFAQEIFARVESGRAEVDQLERALATLRAELATAAARAEALGAGCAGMIPAVPDQLVAGAALMAEHGGHTAAAAANATALTRDVRKNVARMLSALQIGDITRQRVEHVQAGLARLGIDEPGLAPEAQAQLRGAFAAVLAAQLDAARMDFGHEMSAITNGLENLARDAGALLDLRDLAYGRNESGGGGALQGLRERLAGAVGLVGDIERASTQAQETGRAAAAAARHLAERLSAVQTMKTDVVYMALNTILKSARLGEAGRPLSTIATELRAQAGLLETLANGCASALRDLTTIAAGLAAEDGEADGASAQDALAGSLALINQAGAIAERDIAELAAQGGQVTALLQQSTGRIAFEDELGAALAEAARALRELAGGARPLPPELHAPLADRLAELAARYTMAQEREIHAAVTAELGLPPSAAAAPAQEPEEEDALF